MVLCRQSVAPRYFIMLISLERANTVSLMGISNDDNRYDYKENHGDNRLSE